MAGNRLYYGDNLDVLREHVADESVDLIYLDPPFNSNQSYNVLFAERDGSRSAAQIKAFDDTWRWDQAAAAAYQEVVEGGGKVSEALQAFRLFLGDNDMLAYLSMMAPRLVELHRVLKPTGSLYLHCDPTASHCLKLLLDGIFGSDNFRNEIAWRRTGSHGGAKRWGPIHDTILFYSKSERYQWQRVYQDYDAAYLEKYYRFKDKRGSYRLVLLTGAGVRSGDSGKPWRGIDPTDSGRHWAVPRAALQKAYPSRDLSGLSTQEKLDLLDQAGLVYWPERGTVPSQKRYTDENPGVPIQDFINDINPLSAQAKEALGYPTQKPEALLERIVAASSNEGDVVLDPFCGCGTAIAVAQKLGRKWIGIDITHLAINLIRHRLQDAYGSDVAQTYEVIGEPEAPPDAETLAQEDPYQFQWWALGRVGARPVEQKKGADRGIDGRLYFHDEGPRGRTKQIILSVKAGRTGVAHVRDLRGVVDREEAAIGVLISLQEPTRAMRQEVASAGFYHSPGWDRDYPRLQLLTVADLFAGQGIAYPQMSNVTYQRAPRARRKAAGERLL